MVGGILLGSPRPFQGSFDFAAIPRRRGLFSITVKLIYSYKQRPPSGVHSQQTETDKVDYHVISWFILFFIYRKEVIEKSESSLTALAITFYMSSVARSLL